MFFPLSKILGFFASPSNLLLCIGLLGLALMWTRFARTGRRLAATAFVGLALAGLSPLGNWLIAPLEDRFPPWDATRGAPDGIIVLGGSISPELSKARGMPDLNESAERITAVTALARTYPSARIVYSGGSGRLVRRGGVEAEVAGGLLETLGVARSRLILEGRSRNTLENATFSKDLVAPKPGERWLLVTSAYHMPRSIGIFRRVGFPVEAYPVDWRTGGDEEDSLLPFDTLSAGLRRTDTAVREWVGLVAYRLSGHTTALFPAP
jgi:uncharacterized SAM-binding protein YcdF (DUF218 family)